MDTRERLARLVGVGTRFSPHILRRMLDRGFSEVDLRRMLDDAMTLREDEEPGRWVVETSHGKQPWEVVVQPDPLDNSLVVITAYPRTEP